MNDMPPPLTDTCETSDCAMPDREELEAFIDALLMHATQGSISLRVFPHEDGPPLESDVSASVNNGDLTELKIKAFEIASWAARHREPCVFCPPLASFVRPDIGVVRARTKDLLEGYVCSIECDQYPAEALKVLRQVVGQPTLVHASGGLWTNPKTKQVEEKLHIHYRLAEPSRTEAEHKLLRHLRSMLCDLVGGDASNKSVVHPIRWPSIHRKSSPKQTRVIELNEFSEIDLESTVAEIEGLYEFSKRSSDRDKSAGSSQQTDDHELVRDCAKLIRNNDLDWAGWNRLLMAFWSAAAGNDEGLEAARIWSSKSQKHEDKAFEDRWRHYQTSPPTQLGIGTLIYEARKVDKNFLRKRETLIGRNEAKAAHKGEPTERDKLPIIKMIPGYLDIAVSKTEKRLSNTGSVFQRNKQLVRVARLSKSSASEEAVRRRKGSMVIIPCDVAYLQMELCKSAQYQVWSKSEEDWVRVDPPIKACNALLANSGNWDHLNVLTAITEVPVIDHEGRVIDQPGYDEKTGIYFDPGSLELPNMSDSPTREEALSSLAKIKEVLAGFPFVDDASRAVAIATILLPFVRPLLRSAPLSAVTAPKMGSGKTLIATIVGYIATGRVPVLMSQAKDTEEEKKRFLAVLMQGDPIIAMDNISRPIESDAHSTILTEPTWTERLLGSNQNVTVPTAVTWLATGNNLMIAGDMSTRTLVCAIDPRVEKPEEREFAINLHEYVPTNRGRLVAACLTILRAYSTAKAAGNGVKGIKTFGRFEMWSRAIREPLIWLGEADPCDSRDRIEQHDPIRDRLATLCEAWFCFLDDQPYTVKQVISLLPTEATDYAVMEDERAAHATALRDAFEDISNDTKLNSRKIGNFIAKYEGRIEGGFSFQRSDAERRAVKWLVIKDESP